MTERWCPEMARYCACEKRCKDFKNSEQGQILLVIDDIDTKPKSPEKLEKALRWFYEQGLLKK